MLPWTGLFSLPLAFRAKQVYNTGKQLQSSAMVGDSKQTLACSLLSIALLLGLSLNAAFDWWWADPIAGLVLATERRPRSTQGKGVL